MATSVRLIRRYVWLIDTIRRAGQITLEEINKKWMDERSLRLEHEEEIPDRTFHRHRQAIADLFGIDILCNRNNRNSYYIDNDDALNEPSFTSWLFNGLAIDNQLIGNEDVAHLIKFEVSPEGMNFMPVVIQALSEKRKLRISYDSISHGYYDNVILEPYFIKERLRRWYIIGKVNGKDNPEPFAFDRIDDLTLLDEEFEYPKDINPDTHFDEVIGILLDEEYDCERIVLRLYNNQAKYVLLLPMHKSQREIGHGKDYTDFEFNLRPEWEFVHEVLRLGYEAEILSPHWLREEIKWQANEIAKRYT